MSPRNSELRDKVSNAETSPSEKLGLGAGIEQIREILSKMSNADAFLCYKMLGAEHNLSVRSNFAPTAPVPRGYSESSSRTKSGPNRGHRPVVDPAVKEIRDKISLLNSEISSESLRLGKKLEESHALILKRADLFRDLKNLKVTKPTA
jgi:hypothetical protein